MTEEDFDALFRKFEAVGMETFSFVRKQYGEFMPMLVVQVKTGEIAHAMIPHVPNVRPVQVARAMIAGLQSEQVELIVMHFDSYTVNVSLGDTEEVDRLMEEIGKAPLEQLFKQGHPMVVESFVTTMITRGFSKVCSRAYRTSPQDGLEWDKDMPDLIPVDARMTGGLTWDTAFQGAS